MFTGGFEDSNLLAILESLFIMSTVMLLLKYDQAIAVSICSTMEIPYDLALTVTSAGFGNNIIILLRAKLIRKGITRITKTKMIIPIKIKIPCLLRLFGLVSTLSLSEIEVGAPQ